MNNRKRNKTKSRIKLAYIELLKSNNPLDISVSEVCLKSDVNRSTFYEYYSNISDLIEDIIKDQINSISKANRVLYDKFYIDNITGPEDVKKYMLNISSNDTLIRLIKSSESKKFEVSIIKAQCEYEINRYKIEDYEARLRVTYRNYGVLSIIFRWIIEGNNADIDTISNILYKEIKKTECYE